MNYPDLISDLLRRLRGSRTQMEMSRAFGYKFNQFGKWESGQRKIRWREFTKLCLISEIPLEKTLAYCFKFALRVFDQNSAAELIHQFLLIHGMSEKAVIARRLRIQPGALGRMLEGEVDPSLERVFHIMDLAPRFLELFLKRLFETEPGFAAVEDPQDLDQRQLKYISQFPWALSVIGALETSGFKEFSIHKINELADSLSLDLGVLSQVLEDLCHLKILVKKGDSYELMKVRFETGNLPMKEILKPIQYWTAKVAQRILTRISLLEGGDPELEKLPGVIYFSDYRVLSLTPAARDEVNRVIADFVGQIKTIAENQRGPRDKVSCVLLHHFQPGILKPESRFEETWLNTRPETFYWFKKLRKDL